jgi:DNA modification methylase
VEKEKKGYRTQIKNINVFCAFDKIIPIGALIANPKNPNFHPQKQIDMLAKIILGQGWRAPITVSNRSGFIVRGHGRLLAAQKLGMDEVPVEYQNYESEASEFADLVADNKISEFAEISKEELKSLIIDIESAGMDIGLAAVTPDEFIEMKDDGIEEPPTPEPPKTPKSKQGDVYELNGHKLLCGDSIDEKEIASFLKDIKISMIHTDPPYNVDYGANKKNPSWNVRSIKNDKMETSEWQTFCVKLFKIFKQHCAGDIYMWGASGPEGMRMRLWLIDEGAHWSATIVWKKDRLVLSPAKYQRMYEPCFYGWFDKSSYKADRKQIEVWEVKRPTRSDLHPTMKPVEICAMAIKNSSEENEWVLDLFGGSGSTMIACELLNRKCAMVEIDERYVDVIINRYVKYCEDNNKTITIIKNGIDITKEKSEWVII